MKTIERLKELQIALTMKAPRKKRKSDADLCICGDRVISADTWHQKCYQDREFARTLVDSIPGIFALLATAEALEKIVALDDGDNPAFWEDDAHNAFEIARAALESLK